MLVYANYFEIRGSGAEGAVFKAVGGWLKDQLGYGLHPEQMKTDGEYSGHRDGESSWLRVIAATDDTRALYSWVLKHSDVKSPGRQWTTEIGCKCLHDTIELSCVVKADETSTLAALRQPVMASCPRLIRYLVTNVKRANNVEFSSNVHALSTKKIGGDRYSYKALLADIERPERDYVIVLASPTQSEEYLVDVLELQRRLVGIGQLVQILPPYNSYEMAAEIGEQKSAWNGAINLLYPATQDGRIRNRLFRYEEISELSATPQALLNQLLAWVTNATNVSRLKRHIRPEGVMQLAIRNRMQRALSAQANMSTAQLRTELTTVATQVANQEKYFDELVGEISQLESKASTLEKDLDDAKDDLRRKDYELEDLKDKLSKARGPADVDIAPSALVEMALREGPLPATDCLNLIEDAYKLECTILPTAKSSAEEMDRFVNGLDLLRLLKTLVTEYRAKLIEGGDNLARTVFGKNEFAAKESETVMNNKAMRRQRTFSYEGKDVEMFRHIKIGVDDDMTRTIRVHFYWDAPKQKIVIGYCGKHLPIASF